MRERRKNLRNRKEGSIWRRRCDSRCNLTGYYSTIAGSNSATPKVTKESSVRVSLERRHDHGADMLARHGSHLNTIELDPFWYSNQRDFVFGGIAIDRVMTRVGSFALASSLGKFSSSV